MTPANPPAGPEPHLGDHGQPTESVRSYHEYDRRVEVDGRLYRDRVQIPALAESASWRPKGDEKDILLGVYEQVCEGWRAMTDVRFKLLGFLPAISGAVL